MSFETQDTLDPFEIIVVDHGSTDGTMKFLESYRPPFSMLIVKVGKHLSKLAALNAAIAKCHGEFIIFCDGSAIVPPTFLSDHLSYQKQFGGALLSSYHLDNARVYTTYFPKFSKKHLKRLKIIFPHFQPSKQKKVSRLLDPAAIKHSWNDVQKIATLSSSKKRRSWQKAFDKYRQEFFSPWVFCRLHNTSVPMKFIQSYGIFDVNFLEEKVGILEWSYRLWKAGIPVFCLKELVAYKQVNYKRKKDRETNDLSFLLKTHPHIEIELIGFVSVLRVLNWKNYHRCLTELKKTENHYKNFNHFFRFLVHQFAQYIDSENDQLLTFRIQISSELINKGIMEMNDLLNQKKYAVLTDTAKWMLNKLETKTEEKITTISYPPNNTLKLASAEMAEETICPAVSVVIPTYNALKECDFEALLIMLQNQEGFREIETIIVDSGSTDGTVEIAKEYSTKLIQIKPEEFSHSYARNLGAEHTSHDYVLFATQDALPPTNTWLNELYSQIRENNVVAVSCAEFPRENVDLFYRICSTYHYKFLEAENSDKIWSKPSNENYRNIRKNANLSDVSCLVVKNIFMKYKFTSNYAEDLELGIKLIKDGYNLAHLSSTKVIHSHNRTPYYFLKRAYVDNLTLSNFFIDFDKQAIELSHLKKDILFTYKILYSVVNHELDQNLSSIPMKDFAKIILNKFEPVYQHELAFPSSSEINRNRFIDDQFKFFLTNMFCIDDVQENHVPFSSVLLDFLKMCLEYMENTYDVIDQQIIEDFNFSIYKAYALQIGALYANCYINGDEQIKGVLSRIHLELTKGV